MAWSPPSNADGDAKLERVHEITNECLVRRAAGDAVSDESIIAAHPELMPELEEWLHCLQVIGQVDQPAEPRAEFDGDRPRYCPNCDTPLDIGNDHALTCSSCGSVLSVVYSAASSSYELVAQMLDLVPEKLPPHIGRYRIEKLLGKGGFGRVYLAHDEQLGRRVAVKVPHARMVSNTDRAEAYLVEARMVANLEHPHIVPVYDVGSTDEFPCYMVCKYVEGGDLAAKLRQSRLKYYEAAELVARVAETLHYAHTQGLVHRDVKPGNILIDTDGMPFIVDFGLALCDGSFGKGPRYAGTPAYMSPEQALGEGHRVDGRSDIFSLGVVLYELLVGRRPFRGNTQVELFEHISRYEPRPVRQYDDHIPKELQRICHKAMAKRARDRYLTAKEFAEDLQHFLSELSATKDSASNGDASVTRFSTSVKADSASGGGPTSTSEATGSGSSLGSESLRIVPKGLRSFDAHDGDFFLELLPGPRDRNALPESIRFWKTRIEEPDPDRAFSVGLIYGPSGCGKSSLVKAGLLPQLSDDVITVYVEATSEDTEARLTRGLHRLFSELDDLSLLDTLSSLRRGQILPADKKVLIVLDQFEQWLHVNTDVPNTELVQVLRQCDGGRLQCIVLIRDDFWLAATRFMDALGAGLRQGQNTALVDLFDRNHARKVLAAFGRVFGKLPEQQKDTSRQQKEFLKQAVAELAEDDKVVPVRLALFAEMMKGKPWTPITLKQAGGIQGIGVTYLEETFGAQTAHPKHRLHQEAARTVLQTLLPESGTNIKGQMKSYDELLEASGYAVRPLDFDDLIKLLDGELRLITPTDSSVTSEEPQPTGDSSAPATRHTTSTTHYMLTHDYLVPALREWITRKQRETRRGRAELCLANRNELWRLKPENRHLPSLREYLQIAAMTSRSRWNESQREMMRRAAGTHSRRAGSALLLALTVASGVWLALFRVNQTRFAQQATDAVTGMKHIQGRAVPLTIQDLEDSEFGILATTPESMFLTALEKGYSRTKTLSWAYVRAELGQVDAEFLVSKIATALPEEVDNLVIALRHNITKSLAAIDNAAARAERAAKEKTTEKDATPHWRHKARLAVVALHLGNAELSTDMCLIDGRPDPSQRTIFISEFAQWHGSLDCLFDAVAESISAPSPNLVAIRSALCLAIASIAPEQVDKLEKSAKEKWISRFKGWFENQPDKETRSAAGLALRRWDKEPKIAWSRELPQERDWFVNTSGIAMLKIRPGSFPRWYSQDKQDRSLYTPKGRKQVEVPAAFWLADREVTIGQFLEFANAPLNSAEKPPAWPGPYEEFSPTDDHPIQNVSWYDAVLFCNWLSHQEELESCYVPTGKRVTIEIDKHAKAGEERRVFSIAEVNDFESDPKWIGWHIGPGEYEIWDFKARAGGYRLPTEDEWEYACRAGTHTIYSFGNDLNMFGDYVPFHVDKCGTRLPNGWGLFGMHGNLWEICHDHVVRAGGGSPAYLASHTRRDVPDIPPRRELFSGVDGFRIREHSFRVARNDVP